MKTIQDYLNAGILDIAPLLGLALGKSNAELYAQNHYTLDQKQQHKLTQLIQKREQGVPFAYLSGKKGFYHLDFKVTPDTLIPRPETELLIDIILDLLRPHQRYDVLDLGTGSGVIAITLADLRPRWHLNATDKSLNALKIAQTNATTHINFSQGHWFEAVPHQTFDCIISNPPYIEQNDKALNDLTHEPIIALTAGKDGLDDLRMIIHQAPKHLNQKGYLLLEHGFNQQQKIVHLLSKNFTHIQTFKDYNANDRAVLAQVKHPTF